MVFFLAVCELIAFCHIYGVDRISEDVLLMLGKRPHKFYRICWKYVTPAFMIAILFGFLYFYKIPTNDGEPYSELAYSLGILMTIFFLSMLPLCMFFEICLTDKESLNEVKGINSFSWVSIIFYYFQKIKQAFKPHPNWGPRLPENRRMLYSIDQIKA